MASVLREMKLHLKENGFTYLREARHGEFWSDGHTRILVCDSSEPRAMKNVLSEIKRAVERRTTLMQTQEAPMREPRRILVQPRKENLMVPLGDYLNAKKDGKDDMAAESTKVGGFKGYYNKAEKEKLELAIIDLFDEDLSWKVIAQRLNEQGFKNVEGNPITAPTVQYICKRLGLNKNEPRKPPKLSEISSKPNFVTTKAPEPLKPQVIVPMSPNLQESIRMMSQRDKEEPKAPEPVKPQRHFSDLALSILKDPHLAAEKKVKMLLMYVED